MDQKVIDHQTNLDNAFWWVEFAYRQGNALLEAMKGRLADHRFSDPLPVVLYSLAKMSPSKYVWLDGAWYVTGDSVASNRVPFLALSYLSEARTGSHLVVGIAEVESKASGLLTKLNKSEDRQWLLDELLNPSDYPNTFDESVTGDGMVSHSLLKPVARYHQGLERILSAPFPVAWISEESRLDEIAAGLASLRETGDGRSLGALSRAAMNAASAK